MDKLALNKKNLKIRTENGFVDFEGVQKRGIKRLYEVTFTDGTSVRGTAAHFFFTPDGRDIAVAELIPGIELLGTENKVVQDISFYKEDQTYDIINTGTHTFYANGILSHNCEFISDDPLLIDTVVLANLTPVIEKVAPIGRAGEIIFFEKPRPHKTYLVGVDCATGSKQDFTTIEVFSFPEMVQVAEYRSNTVSSPLAYHFLKKVIHILRSTGSDVYFSVENNGVGEGIISLHQSDEFPPDATFVSDDPKQVRDGMTTTAKAKLKACLSLKEMVERNLITIKSLHLLTELKMYVRSGPTYKAKIGGTDDLISAVLIIVRILAELATYDQRAYDTMHVLGFGQGDEFYDESDYAGALIVC